MLTAYHGDTRSSKMPTPSRNLKWLGICNHLILLYLCTLECIGGDQILPPGLSLMSIWWCPIGQLKCIVCNEPYCHGSALKEGSPDDMPISRAESLVKTASELGEEGQKKLHTDFLACKQEHLIFFVGPLHADFLDTDGVCAQSHR